MAGQDNVNFTGDASSLLAVIDAVIRKYGDLAQSQNKLIEWYQENRLKTVTVEN